MGNNKKCVLTEARKAYIEEKYKYKTMKAIAEDLGISRTSVFRHCAKNNLLGKNRCKRKPPEPAVEGFYNPAEYKDFILGI